MHDLITKLLNDIGEDPTREGLQKTPKRWEEAMKFLTSGYDRDLKTLVNGALFEAETQESVLIKDIEFASLCEHHLLPFEGRVYVGYIPQKYIIGLSKIPRVVEMFARRLQTQERLTTQITDALQKTLQPKALGVVIESRHFCMVMRGVEKQHARVTTQAFRGLYKEGATLRGEFLRSIQS